MRKILIPKWISRALQRLPGREVKHNIEKDFRLVELNLFKADPYWPTQLSSDLCGQH